MMPPLVARVLERTSKHISTRAPARAVLRPISALSLVVFLSGPSALSLRGIANLGGLEGQAFAQTGAPAATKSDGKTDTKAEAARHFKRGLELFDENDFQGALIEFQRAYQIAPTFQVLYNIGQVRFQLQDYAGALKSFDRFLAEGGDKIPAERRAEIERDIAKLRARVATVEITTAKGAMIYVDDVAMGTAPLSAPLQVSGGRRRVRAVLAGSPPAEKVLELAGGDSTRVDLPIEIAPLASSTPVTEEPKSSTGPVVAWALAGAFAIGTGVTGFLALNDHGKMNDAISSGGSFKDFDAARSDTKTMSLVADILGAATIVTVAIATYLTVTNGKKSSASAKFPLPLVRTGGVPGTGAFGLTF